MTVVVIGVVRLSAVAVVAVFVNAVASGRSSISNRSESLSRSLSAACRAMRSVLSVLPAAIVALRSDADRCDIALGEAGARGRVMLTSKVPETRGAAEVTSTSYAPVSVRRT